MVSNINCGVMISYSDSATPMAVYLDWESKDGDGNPLGVEERKRRPLRGCNV